MEYSKGIIEKRSDIEVEIKILNHYDELFEEFLKYHNKAEMEIRTVEQENFLFKVANNENLRMRKETDLYGNIDVKYTITKKRKLNQDEALKYDDNDCKCRVENTYLVDKETFNDMLEVSTDIFGGIFYHYKLKRTIIKLPNLFNIEFCFDIENLTEGRYLYNDPFIEIEKLGNRDIKELLYLDLKLDSGLLSDLRSSNKSLITISNIYRNFEKNFKYFAKDYVEEKQNETCYTAKENLDSDNKSSNEEIPTTSLARSFHELIVKMDKSFDDIFKDIAK